MKVVNVVKQFPKTQERQNEISKESQQETSLNDSVIVAVPETEKKGIFASIKSVFTNSLFGDSEADKSQNKIDAGEDMESLNGSVITVEEI